MYQHDIIKRLIEQIAQFVARAVGLMREGRLEEAEAELGAAENALGLPRGHERLDDATVALLLSGSDKARLLADILEKRALLADGRGEDTQAEHFRQRATVLRGAKG